MCSSISFLQNFTLANEVNILDLHLSIPNGFVTSKIYDNSDIF